MASKRNSFLWIYILSLLLLRSHSTTTPGIYDLNSLLALNKAAFQIATTATNALFGTSVSNAGDINKDGYDDILVGASTASSSKGEVYVIYGKPDLTTSDIINLNVNGLNPSQTGFKITGDTAGGSLGASVSGAGDFDGDGYDDIIIGAPNKNGRGAAYVIFGMPNSARQHIDLGVTPLEPTTTGFMITGNGATDHLGYAVGAAGDINKDGVADILIGAPGQNSNTGAVYAIYGRQKSATLWANLDPSMTTLDPAVTGVVIRGSTMDDLFGSSVGAAGRINNDEYDDFIIGAPGKDQEGGVAYVFYGKEKTISSHFDLSLQVLSTVNAGYMITGRGTGDMFGSSCGNAGDMNGDTRNEIFVAAKSRNSYQGEVYIIYGQASGFSSDFSLSGTTPLDPTSTGFIITGDVSWSGFGFSVAQAGDVNGDGKADIIIGAVSKGAVYVIYGGLAQNIALASFSFDPMKNGFAITGTISSSQFGSSVSAALGLRLNGKTALLVGAPQASSIGNAYVIFPSQLCANNCLQCTKMDACTRCDPALGYGLENSVCKLCPDGKYSITGSDSCLTDCPTGCGKCYQGSSLLVCKECASGYFVLMTDISSGEISVTCASCPIGCTACSSTGGCIACSTDKYHLVNNICCPLSCSTCSSSSVCTACNNPYGLVGTECKICSSGSVVSGGTCVACDVLMPYCATCTIPTICNSCSNGMVLYNSACMGSCQPGNYNSNGVCQTCSSAMSDCTTCTSSSVCTACITPKLVQNSRCVDSCLDGFYSTGVACAYCHSSCETCFGASASDCLSCLGKFLYNSRCVSQCPIGTYQANGKCESCSNIDNSCVACSSSSICTSCSGSLLVLNSKCVPSCPTTGYYSAECSAGCNKCVDSITCTACVSGYGLYMSRCFDPCPDGTFSGGGRCARCHETCSKCTDLSRCTACEAGYGLIQSQCVVCPKGTYLKDELCKGCPVGCSKCTSNSICQACHEGYFLSNSYLCESEEIENDREKAAGDAFEGSSITGAALASGSSLPINFGLVAKIIRNLKYLNVTVSTELKETFHSWRVNAGFLKAPKSWSQESSSKPLPGVFSRYGLDPVFLINYWKPLIMTLIGFILFVAFKIMEIGLSKSNDKRDPLKTSIPRKLNLAASNFALTQIYSNLDDVIFYFVIDARSTEFDGAFRGFSLTLAVVLIIIGCIILGFHGFLLQKYQSIKKDNSLKRFLYKYENVKLIFQDFKDTTLVVQAFLWIHLVRALISSLIFTMLFEYPLAQILLLFILNIGMIGFISMKSPFKDILGTFSQLFCEIILFLANICMLVMAIFDQTKSYSIEAMTHLSRAIIVLNAILLFGSAILMILGILKDFHIAYKEKKKTQQQAIPSQVKNHRIMNTEKLVSTFTGSDKLQQSSSTDFENTRNYPYEPKKNYFKGTMANCGNQKVTTTLYDLNSKPNAQNHLEISDLSHDRNNRPAHRHSNNYQIRHLENTFENSIDETMMNTSNVDLLQHSSPIRAKPRIKGKIKMPGGVEINPRSNNGAVVGSALDSQSFPNIQSNNPRPPNLEILNPNLNHSEFKSQLGSPDFMENQEAMQKRNRNQYEEFILERTRARMKYHNARKTASYK